VKNDKIIIVNKQKIIGLINRFISPPPFWFYYSTVFGVFQSPREKKAGENNLQIIKTQVTSAVILERSEGSRGGKSLYLRLCLNRNGFPVAVVCRFARKYKFASKLALWATPLAKTIAPIVFASLTQNSLALRAHFDE
jgi:hypothetical protein